MGPIHIANVRVKKVIIILLHYHKIVTPYVSTILQNTCFFNYYLIHYVQIRVLLCRIGCHRCPSGR